MRIFRTALSIVLRHPIYLGVYVLFLSAIGSFITGSAVYVDEAAETYEPARPVSPWSTGTAPSSPVRFAITSLPRTMWSM